MSAEETVTRSEAPFWPWVRAISSAITAVFAAGAAVIGLVVFVFEPRAVQWTVGVVDTVIETLQSEITENTEARMEFGGQLDRLEQAVSDLSQSLVQLVEKQTARSLPSWRFSVPDTHVSDGPIGGSVIVTASGFKLRDCGVPVIDLYFVGRDGIYHRFLTSSVVNASGRGIALPVRPADRQVVRYSVTIPDDENVQVGRAMATISVTYPERCPTLEPAVASNLQFRILPPIRN